MSTTDTYSFKFKYNKAFLVVNIIGIAACFLAAVANIIAVVFDGMGVARLLFALVFLALGFSAWSQMYVSLTLDGDGLCAKSAFGRTRIPLSQIELVEQPAPDQVTAKNILVRYFVSVDNKRVVSIFVTDKSNIVILTRKVENATFRYAISCPSPQAASALCATASALTSK